MAGALTLAQVVDLAVGTEVPSVNFLHLKQALVTVVTALDLGDITVWQNTTQHDAIDTDNGGMLDDDLDDEMLLSDDDENLQDVNKPGIDGELSSEKANHLQEDENGQDNVDNKKLPKDNNQGSTKKCVKQKRVEGSVSRASKVGASQNFAVLTNKIQVLEQGLQRLRGLVGDLIAQGDFSVDLKERAGTQDLAGNVEPTGNENVMTVPVAQRGASARLLREVSTLNSELKRPVTQPVVARKQDGTMPRNPPDLARFEKPGNKQDSGVGEVVAPPDKKGTMLEKLKEARRNTTKTQEQPASEKHKVVKVEGNGGSKDTDNMVVRPPDIPNIPELPDSVLEDIAPDEDAEMANMVEQEIEACLSDPSDPQGAVYAVRLGLEQMQTWREQLLRAQQEFRQQIGTCRGNIDKMQGDLRSFRTVANAQNAERFNAIHHVHNLVFELDGKQTKMSKTVDNLVDEFNRHDAALNDVFGAIEKLDEQKADNVLLSSQVGEKANKDELRDKVSLSTFDASFMLLDRGLNEALEKMDNQMSMEEALRETMCELEAGMQAKLNREEMQKLACELETRIKEVRAAQAKAQEATSGGNASGEPAGFKRKTETVRCISCDRDMDMAPSQIPAPALPKIQPMVGGQVNKINQSQQDSKYDDVIQGTGLLDMPAVSTSQRFCGGRHTIMRATRRFPSSSHFNDFLVIRNDASSVVSLPSRDFIVPKESGASLRHLRPRLPAIQETENGVTSNIDTSSRDSAARGVLAQEEELGRTKRVKKKLAIVSKIPVCKSDGGQ